MSLVEACMDLLFILDIFINFRTAYTDDITGELVTDSMDVFWVRPYIYICILSFCTLQAMRNERKHG